MLNPMQKSLLQYFFQEMVFLIVNIRTASSFSARSSVETQIVAGVVWILLRVHCGYYFELTGVLDWFKLGPFQVSRLADLL